jgi:hypothetical protein
MPGTKSLWAYVQQNPTFMRRLNGWLTLFWIAMIPVSIVMGWLSSVAYVSALSLWALVSGHWAAWQAARVEVAQSDEIARAKAKPLERRVVDALFDEIETERVTNGASRGGRRARDGSRGAARTP